MKKESILFTLCLVLLIITLAIFLFIDSHLLYEAGQKLASK